jgi:hypothetical protein
MDIRKGILAGVVAAACVGTDSAAEGPGFYIGALAGSTDFNYAPAADYSKSEFTWGLFTGWQFNKYFAAELGYYKPASITSSVSGASSKLSLHTIATSLIGSYPVGDNWSVFARVGAGFPTVKNSVSSSSLSGSWSDSSTELHFGGGAALAVRKVQLRFEYTRLETESYLAGNLISLGIVIPIRK